MSLNDIITANDNLIQRACNSETNFQNIAPPDDGHLNANNKDESDSLLPSPQEATTLQKNDEPEIEIVIEQATKNDDVGCTQHLLNYDFAQIAINMAQSAEDFVSKVWLRGWSVVHQPSLPQWLRDNEFLVRWHRPQLKSFQACFNSIFRVHTETGNIWTHLLGCAGFIALTIFFMCQPSGNVHWQEKVVFGVFFFGAILCLGFSFIFHTVYCHSEKVGLFFNKLDYCGIAFLTVGSFVPWLHYSFYCKVLVKVIYLVTITLLGFLCIVVSLFDKFAESRFRPLRAALFIALGLCGVIPAAHITFTEGWYAAIYNCCLGWLTLMAILYITGAVIYAVRIPERVFPGSFDLWGQSHQIFHIFVVVAAYVHYHGVVSLANYRLTQGDCPLTQT